nr:hypothetical protein [Tanacetum cinerariifolium]
MVFLGVKVRSSSQRFGILLVNHSGLAYCSGGLSGKYTVLVVCQESTLFWRFAKKVHCASGLSFLTAVCLIKQSSFSLLVIKDLDL